MTDPSLRRLALADLDGEMLDRLILHGEDLFVERKLKPPAPPKFGAEVASFANTMGGWLLLGVRDDRGVDGYDKPNQLDLQSHLADVLRKEIDPLPAFVAEMFEHNGKPVGVMRIFESADAPHIVRGTGAVYVRSSKGKEPVNDHRTLLAIAQKGEQAEALASERMRTLPSVAEALTTGEEDLEIVFTARAAPVTMNPAASDWVLTRAGEHAVVESADRLLPGPPPPQPGSLQIGRREGPVVLPFGRAVSATVRQSGLFQEARTAVVVADSGGVFAAQLRTGPESAPQQREDVEHSFLVDAIFESDLRPLARCFADLLASGEVYGRALLNLTIAMPPATSIYQARRMTPPTEPLFSSGELTIPADQDEVDALAEYWDRELHRQLGVARYEGEPRAS